MKLQRVRVVLPIIVGAAAVAAVIALPSTAASPPNFDIRASGPVGFDCWEGGGFPNCNPPAFLIFGNGAGLRNAHRRARNVQHAREVDADQLHREQHRRERRGHRVER